MNVDLEDCVRLFLHLAIVGMAVVVVLIASPILIPLAGIGWFINRYLKILS